MGSEPEGSPDNLGRPGQPHRNIQRLSQCPDQGRRAQLAFLGEIEDRLVDTLRDKPVKICWGTKDPVFTEDDFLNRLWLTNFPDAEVVRLPDSSHFVPEDACEVVVPEVLELVGRD